jgi:hypothetical protein
LCRIAFGIRILIKKFSAEVFDSKGIDDDWGNRTSSCFPIPYIGHDEYI